MELVHRVCCGLDVHKKQVTACVRRAVKQGKMEQEVRQFSTTVAGLTELSSWLEESGCKAAAMESTGVYWKPVYHVLAPSLDELIVGNARDIRPPPGKKTDRADAKWIAELLAHGLIMPSFIPPPNVQALRDLTRTRVTLVQTRSSAKNRVHRILEDTNVKLGSVVSDLFGKSSRAMLDALIRGERDPKKLARLAKGVLKRKISALELALVGSFTEHHGTLIQLALEQVDLLDEQIRELDRRIAVLTQELGSEVEQLSSMPGVDVTASATIVAEIGTDMTKFGSDSRLASWAGICPGNNESAGKRRSGKTRHGNKWLKRILTTCAWSARKTDSHLGRTFLRLEKRIGRKKAAVAVGHRILVIAYHLLDKGSYYEEDRYVRLRTKEEKRKRRIAMRMLESIGYEVELSVAE